MPNTAIKNIKIQNFTRFENTDLTFCEGINVVIGQNGTGKTHLGSRLSNSLVCVRPKQVL